MLNMHIVEMLSCKGQTIKVNHFKGKKKKLEYGIMSMLYTKASYSNKTKS